MASQPKIHITLAVTNDLVTDRRVLRHAEALLEAGYEVRLVGRRRRGSPAVAASALVKRMRLLFSHGPLFYAEYNLRLCLLLLSTRCDVIVANDTDTLLACYVAARLRGCPLVFDAHELFPEVPELVGRSRVKRFWQRLEDFLIPRADACMTVCQSIADYYRSRLGVAMTVVRNLSWTGQVVGGQQPEAERSGGNSLKVMLYQGCVNRGRGVDWAIDSLQHLANCRLVVAGDGDLLEAMKHYASQKPWADRIEFLGRLAPSELEQLTRQADVGLVMLDDLGLSYHFALPNRIGDFVAAGVPIVVSNLPEMASIVRQFGIGAIMSQPGAEALAMAVEEVLSQPRAHYDFAAAREDMNWLNESKKLTQIIETICCTTSF